MKQWLARICLRIIGPFLNRKMENMRRRLLKDRWRALRLAECFEKLKASKSQEERVEIVRAYWDVVEECYEKPWKKWIRRSYLGLTDWFVVR